jgi:hypothetical protein
MMAATGIGRCQKLVAVGSTNVAWRSLIDSQCWIPGSRATVGTFFWEVDVTADAKVPNHGGSLLHLSDNGRSGVYLTR